MANKDTSHMDNLRAVLNKVNGPPPDINIS